MYTGMSMLNDLPWAKFKFQSNKLESVCDDPKFSISSGPIICVTIRVSQLNVLMTFISVMDAKWLAMSQNWLPILGIFTNFKLLQTSASTQFLSVQTFKLQEPDSPFSLWSVRRTCKKTQFPNLRRSRQIFGGMCAHTFPFWPFIQNLARLYPKLSVFDPQISRCFGEAIAKCWRLYVRTSTLLWVRVARKAALSSKTISLR